MTFGGRGGGGGTFGARGALAGLERRGASRVGDASVGTLDELKAIAKTPEDLARIHQTADGRFYLPDAPDDMLGSLTGNYDIQNAKMAMLTERMAQGDPTGAAGRRLMIQKAKNGFELGPMWQDVEDLNRGRAVTGAAAPNDPFEGFWGATQQAANMQGRINAGAVDQAQRGQAVQDASRDYTNYLGGKGLDTEKAAYELGPNWQGSSSGQLSQYQWGEPQSAALGRRQQTRRQGAMR